MSSNNQVKKPILKIIEDFAIRNQRKYYMNKYMGKQRLTAIILDFIRYIEEMNNTPAVDVLIQVISKGSYNPEKIKELELEIKKLKEGEV